MAKEPKEIEREIEKTRAALAEAVDAMAAKVNPKAVADKTIAQAKESVSGAVDKATAAASRPDPKVFVVVGVVALVVVVLLVRRRASRRSG